ncbi:glycerol-3-phosphate 1-O-acyltransferase PlsY [Ohessyouella blattaphilus]|uniref:Glycerol-3-phosphate acyltransferase n=1 Tax=Ohessyouella blattaphilus TaxID=2949333 RepID=A0ABT1EI29_9FIRM|nr:glycerol-3-phosphate 1-O-acyltransferase PlsY [Ohessyouella blattaphilus]MCP1109422.1 glycerol-3-phosphate 1-O-acyltransferase PlsY [Ohessyouella blattaphilus]MCR8562816.1 glycerol-3-phosphate 1-O-acyltransferase PlsY [Ohessyouella blattaphilus]
MERVLCLLIGYVFGLFQTSYLYGKMHGIDIRETGSGNAGTTNALRTLGKRAGIITLLGDAFKCVLAVVVVHLLYRSSRPEMLPLLSMYAGFGAVLGHNYPIQLGFKGGKGIAATAGIILSTTNVWVVLICLAAFIAIVATTRYVSVGSLVIVTIYLISVIVRIYTGSYNTSPKYYWEMILIATLFLISAVLKHRENIKRLLNGTENKISFSSKKKEV